MRGSAPPATVPPMNTPEIAQRLVALCRQGAYETAQRELYADHVVSLEPAGTPGHRAEGLAAIIAKGKMFYDTFEVHGGSVSEPVVAGNFFSCALTADVTPRAGGPRFTMAEIAVYEVRDGKIVLEQFFYPAQG